MQERKVSDRASLGQPTCFNGSLFKFKLQANKKKAEKVGMNRGKLLRSKSQRRPRAIGQSPIQTVAFQAVVLMSNTADVRGHKQLFRVNYAHYR